MKFSDFYIDDMLSEIDNCYDDYYEGEEAQAYNNGINRVMDIIHKYLVDDELCDNDKWIEFTPESQPIEEGNYLVSIDPDYLPLDCDCVDTLMWYDGKWCYVEVGEKPSGSYYLYLEDFDVPIDAWQPMPKRYIKKEKCNE